MAGVVVAVGEAVGVGMTGVGSSRPRPMAVISCGLTRNSVVPRKTAQAPTRADTRDPVLTLQAKGLSSFATFCAPTPACSFKPVYGANRRPGRAVAVMPERRACLVPSTARHTRQ